jgi:glycosyltransferase involved in cell wall biosynthesis
VNTLVKGLEIAMDSVPSLKFVSVGRGVVNNNQYDLLVSLTSKSRHKDRFILLDWMEASKLPVLFAESNIGVTTNLSCYEITLGNKTNPIVMTAAGLPVVSTDGCQVTDILSEAGAGITVPIGDFQRFADAILHVINSPSAIEEMRIKCRELISDRLSYEKTTLPLLKWAEKPTFAPDKHRKRRFIRLLNRLGWLRRQIQYKLFNRLP